MANKTVNGHQCTVTWHIDDLKISCKDPTVVEDLVDKLSERYGKHKALTINRGKIHDYLGMILDFSDKGKVKVQMYDYI